MNTEFFDLNPGDVFKRKGCDDVLVKCSEQGATVQDLPSAFVYIPSDELIEVL